MEVLLLTDISGVGQKNDLLTVKSGYAMNFLLPKRLAIVATPKVRQQYADLIKKRAEERAKEKEIQESLAVALADKTVVLTKEASKTGKLYAAVSAKEIVEALKEQFSVSLSDESIVIKDAIKAGGTHTVTVNLGTQSTPLSVEVKTEEKKK